MFFFTMSRSRAKQAAVRAATHDCTVLRITGNALATTRLGLEAAAHT